MTDEARFLAALPIIDDVTSQVCRRHHLSAAEADDFRSDVRLHFIENNYAVLRRFEGRASLATYVTIVVQHLFLDLRNRTWGRWRPTAEARRLGPTAILIERLVTRDGWSVDQAIEQLRVNHGIPPDERLQVFCEKLVSRGPSRKFVSEDEAQEIANDGPSADANVVRAEQDFLAKRVQAALYRARQTLAPMDRLILKMRFEDRVPVVDIARALHLDQRRLYRSIERLLTTIRDRMIADGISRSEVETLLADDSFSWNPPAVDADAGTAGLPADRERRPWAQER